MPACEQSFATMSKNTNRSEEYDFFKIIIKHVKNRWVTLYKQPGCFIVALCFPKLLVM